MRDQSRGYHIEISKNDSGGFSMHSGGSCFDIVGVTLETGEIRVIVENALCPSLSHNGRYFVYMDTESSTIAVYDLEENESWAVTDDIDFFSPPSFSADDSHIIFDIYDKSGDEYLSQFHTVPLHGGEIVQITFYDGSSDEGKLLGFPKYSPDGSWILYTDCSSLPRKLALLDTNSGESIDVFDANVYQVYKGHWSSDGKKICYMMRDIDGDYRIFIRDMDLPGRDIQVGVDIDIPESISLLGNYPNPFNPTTTIEFTLPEAGFANLIIYNVTGQKVRELSEGHMSAGLHTVVWNGRDDLGLPVSAGVYVSRLEMGDAVTNGKMTLVK